MQLLMHPPEQTVGRTKEGYFDHHISVKASFHNLVVVFRSSIMVLLLERAKGLMRSSASAFV